MHVISTIIFGLVVGIIAKFLMPGKNEPQGFVLTAILGIVGAYVGQWLGEALGIYQPGQAAGWIASILGAMLLLFIWGMVVKNRAA
jgi:uncharacterized membrane protein YeaQ/YmgE (transglycosylase-associated protein family)